MKERLYEILNEEKIHEIVPFLQELTEDERKTLIPTIKKMDREISKIVMTTDRRNTEMGMSQLVLRFYQ